jgi:hypothetical protein
MTDPTTATTDPYEVLQVIPGAEPDVIRAAYRALAARWHPDRGAPPERMVAINAAWHILGDPGRRAAFDAKRPRHPMPSPSHAPEAAASPSSPATGLAARRPREERTSETILDFGRYEGWTVTKLVEHDPDYLIWLARTPIGRRLAPEIDAALVSRESRAAALAPRPTPRTLPFLRRRAVEAR